MYIVCHQGSLQKISYVHLLILIIYSHNDEAQYCNDFNNTPSNTITITYKSVKIEYYV